ncbi:multidrug resistance efflux transporter family protein [Luteolibacter ambystomatis]|uniref:Multidrug resistance efflux transporter family protein n=1 Tax=Luteolibacter ambystomatis TaxID=2824561 RepID=A0A975IZG7_9BACT|nr:multidrug resistance efflux transporter family protein [Luteolibacter ambystomatis]QUE51451.1 multidrug resistance efflux transporter family protein [Luteolibacter ambystomatis]
MNPDSSQSRLWRGLGLGMLAAAFFSVSFVLSRQMAEANGHWAWTASLRFLMMLPMLLGILVVRGRWSDLWQAWKAAPLGWIVWGTVGCGLFYVPLVAACAISPAWVVAGSWPVAIVIGIVIAPWLYDDHRRHIPRRALGYSSLIVIGVMLLQVGQAREVALGPVLVGLMLVLVSATAHPIGNRMSMQLMEKQQLRPDAVIRLTALTIGSLPAWLALCAWGWFQAGWPPAAQWSGSLIVAACGVIATPMFYAATQSVSREPEALAAVEATQAAEILFTLLFEAILIGIHPPDVFGIVGLAVIIGGILMHAAPRRSLRT